jgi:hypothetical protein
MEAQLARLRGDKDFAVSPNKVVFLGIRTKKTVQISGFPRR